MMFRMSLQSEIKMGKSGKQDNLWNISDSVNVSSFSLKLHTITDLRNNTLKQRHWEKIENILDYKFVPEDPLTLGKLIEMKAFQKAEEIEEISGQASAEDNLELILKKAGYFYFVSGIFDMILSLFLI